MDLNFEITQVIPQRNKTNVPELITAPTKGMIRINAKAAIVMGLQAGMNVMHLSNEGSILKQVADGKLVAVENGYKDEDGNVHNVRHFIANYKDKSNNATSVTATTGKTVGMGQQVQFTNNTMWGSLNGSTKELKVYELQTPGIEHTIGDDTVMLYELKFVETRSKAERSEKEVEDKQEDVVDETTDIDANPFKKAKK